MKCYRVYVNGNECVGCFFSLAMALSKESEFLSAGVTNTRVEIEEY